VVAQFKAKYPGFSEKGAQAVAADLVEQAKSRGIDPELYVYGNTDQFLDDVAQQYEKEFGKPQVSNGAGQEQERKDAEAAGARGDEEAMLRTLGVFGGQEGGHAPTGGGKHEPVRESTMGDEHRKMQAETGLFWDM
jgi:hypothetical protein